MRVEGAGRAGCITPSGNRERDPRPGSYRASDAGSSSIASGRHRVRLLGPGSRHRGGGRPRSLGLPAPRFALPPRPAAPGRWNSWPAGTRKRGWRWWERPRGRSFSAAPGMSSPGCSPVPGRRSRALAARGETGPWMEGVIDEALASPHFGERWARHWLDVARYADTKGYDFQGGRLYPYAFAYRDWVVRSLNEDLPYDEFIRRQIAADLLEVESRELAALGFLTVGRRFLRKNDLIIADRIDVVFRSTMALTMQCVRCHDHKSDPLTMADYYGLYGVFDSIEEPQDLPVISPPEESESYEAVSGRADQAGPGRPRVRRKEDRGLQAARGSPQIRPAGGPEKAEPDRAGEVQPPHRPHDRAGGLFSGRPGPRHGGSRQGPTGGSGHLRAGPARQPRGQGPPGLPGLFPGESRLGVRAGQWPAGAGPRADPPRQSVDRPGLGQPGLDALDGRAPASLPGRFRSPDPLRPCTPDFSITSRSTSWITGGRPRPWCGTS